MSSQSALRERAQAGADQAAAVVRSLHAELQQSTGIALPLRLWDGSELGDGGAHAHPFFFGRPARMLQLRGSCLLDWEENLPAVPEDVHLANAGHVGRRLVERVGGEGPAWEA